MLRVLRVLALCLTACWAVPHYHIVVRLSAPSDHPISAQFKLLQPKNSSRVWDCVSGLTPIVYPAGDEQVVKAQSIDMDIGSVVECLGLSVSVVESTRVPRWEGEDTTCPGLLTSTTQLERSHGATTEYFQLTPLTLFHVFVSRPSKTCVTEHVLKVPPPELSFRYHGDTLQACVVISQHIDIMACNLTISTSNQDIISMAIGSPEILVPQFIWRVGVDSIECRCDCRITPSDTDTVRSNTITHKNRTDPPLPPELDTFGSDERPCKNYIVVIGVVSGVLLLTTISTVFLVNTSRDLRRRLGRATGKRCRVTGMKRPPPPDLDYSRIHRITNECHHYNTVSLRLSDCGNKELVKSQTFPIYQKLSFSEHSETL